MNLRQINISFLVFICMGCFGCVHNPEYRKNQESHPLEADFARLDSIFYTGDSLTLNLELDRIRPLIPKRDIISWSNYYMYRGGLIIDPRYGDHYVDSALNLFDNHKIQQQHQKEYIKVLITKAQSQKQIKNYDEALDYYFKVKSLVDPTENPLSYAQYNTQIALLYYLQQRYHQAAQYHLIALSFLQDIQHENPQFLFYHRQAAISNAGIAYERAMQLDSAAHLYTMGLAYIDEEDKKNLVGKRILSASRIVFLDNLGGLKAQTGDLSGAKELLEQAIAIPSSENDPSKITTYLKLANVHRELGNLNIADSLLNISEYILNLSGEDNFQIRPRILKAKSDLFLAAGEYKLAHAELAKHLQALDSLQQKNRKLSGIDLELKMESKQDKQDIATLSKTIEKRTHFLIITAVFLFMLVMIIVLILKNAQQIRKAKQTATDYNAQLEKVIAQLELSNQEYAKIMKLMAHDLKNPLSGIVGISTVLLEEKELKDEQQELLQLISDSGYNMLEMIDELLDAKLTEEKGDFSRENVDLNQLIQQCVELLQFKAREKRQIIYFQGEKEIILPLSREKIWRVINNLIVNAIKFSPLDSKIEVSLGKQNGKVLIAFKDNGIGIPEEEKERVFDLFTASKRVGTAGEKPFGLGLSASRQIIEAHQGRIWPEDNPEGGTIFYIELPDSKI